MIFQDLKAYDVKPSDCAHAKERRKYARPRTKPLGGYILTWKCLECGYSEDVHREEPAPSQKLERTGRGKAPFTGSVDSPTTE